MIRLDLVAGPNGGGKTTFVNEFLAPSLPPGTPFVNADLIAARQWPDDPEAAGRQASDAAAAARSSMIAAQRPFITETVFSHPSKVDLVRDARDRGYRVFLHVLMVPEHLSVHRVAARVAAGGHSVPEHKVRERHRRLWGVIAQAVPMAQSATFWDNSRSDRPTKVATFAEGFLAGGADWPAWAPAVLRHLTDRRVSRAETPRMRGAHAIDPPPPGAVPYGDR